MEELILRTIHIAGGIVWAGSSIFLGFFLIPALKEAGPASGAVIGGMIRRGLTVVMDTASTLTILAGLRIYYLHFTYDWLKSPNGIVLTLGIVFALAASYEGLFIARPTGRRMGLLTQSIHVSGGAPKPEQVSELKALHARLVAAARTGAILLSFTVLMMAANRLSMTL